MLHWVREVAEFALGKRARSRDISKRRRMGAGIYGAKSACRYYDETPGRSIAGNKRKSRCHPTGSSEATTRAQYPSGWAKWDGNRGQRLDRVSSARVDIKAKECRDLDGLIAAIRRTEFPAGQRLQDLIGDIAAPGLFLHPRVFHGSGPVEYAGDD